MDAGSQVGGESVPGGRSPWAARGPEGRHRRPRGVPRPQLSAKVHADEDDAIEPLGRWEQALQDVILAFGPCVEGVFIVSALPEAHLISHAQGNYSLALVALPVAVALWHVLARPPIPPPAGPARRDFTRAAAVTTLVFGVAAVAVTVTLIARHADGVFWWWPLSPFLCTFLTLQTARRARLRYDAPPDQAAA